MISEKYITYSLELHLFWGRIMKEHSLFLEAGFTPKNMKLSKEADHFKKSFEKLLIDVVKMSNTNIRQSVLDSGEIFTDYTLDAEKKTEFYTGIDINTKLTLMEKDLDCKNLNDIDSKMIKCVKNINAKAIKLLDGLIDFKMKLLDGVLCCDLFTVNYPSLIEHVIEEAKLYRSHVRALESNKDTDENNINETVLFWNEIMMEHALFIRGLLDPSEKELIMTSNKFAAEFCELIQKTNDNIDITSSGIKNETLMETIKLRDFNKAGTNGLVNCKIKSIILPLLSDHVLREANHYIRVLNECKEV